MTPEEGFLLLARWAHALAAMTWIGGSLFYVLVLRPVQRESGGQGSALGPDALHQFRSVVDICITVLLVTGIILLFQRLTGSSIGVAYFVTVSIKIALALWMFAIARGRWQRRRPARTPSMLPGAPRTGLVARALSSISGVNVTVALGIAVLFLSDLLRFLVEEGLTGK